MGVPPKPFYDPLKFAVDEGASSGAAATGLAQPYRVRHSDARRPKPAAGSMSAVRSRRLFASMATISGSTQASRSRCQRFIDVVTDVVRSTTSTASISTTTSTPIRSTIRTASRCFVPDDESYARAMAARSRAPTARLAAMAKPPGHGEEAAHGDKASTPGAEEHGRGLQPTKKKPPTAKKRSTPPPTSMERRPAHGDEGHGRGLTARRLRSRRCRKSDWRRQNCDRLVEEMYNAVKKEKPWVLVGSPSASGGPVIPKGFRPRPVRRALRRCEEMAQ